MPINVASPHNDWSRSSRYLSVCHDNPITKYVPISAQQKKVTPKSFKFLKNLMLVDVIFQKMLICHLWRFSLVEFLQLFEWRGVKSIACAAMYLHCENRALAGLKCDPCRKWTENVNDPFFKCPHFFSRCTYSTVATVTLKGTFLQMGKNVWECVLS